MVFMVDVTTITHLEAQKGKNERKTDDEEAKQRGVGLGWGRATNRFEVDQGVEVRSLRVDEAGTSVDSAQLRWCNWGF